MFISFIKIALRTLGKDKFHTFINIFSLSVGISACLLIFLYIKTELSYDKYHQNSDRIYRVATELNLHGSKDVFGFNSASIATELYDFYPEIENFCRLKPLYKPLNIEHNHKVFQEEKSSYADSTLLDFFDYKLLKGNRKKVLEEANTIIISDEKALKYFGSVEKAIHKTLTLAHNKDKKLKIVGVFQTEKRHTHLDIDIFISFKTLPKYFFDTSKEDIMWMNTVVYVMLQKHTKLEAFEPKLKKFYNKRLEPWLEKHKKKGGADTIIYHFQPLPDIHLGSNIQYDFTTNNDRTYLYIFSFVGIFLLLIASINYMNLATAKSAKRAKEVGIRKVIGARKEHLIQQFLGESFLITFLAYLLSLLLVEFLLPVFNYLTDKNLSFADLMEGKFLVYSWLGLIALALVSGSYPALYLARFKPASVLKTSRTDKKTPKKFPVFISPKLLRKVLVIKQFALSIAMIISTIIVFSQLRFMQNKNLGLNKEQVLVIDMPQDTQVIKQIKNLKHELKKHKHIHGVATSNFLPSIRVGRIVNIIEDKGKRINKLINFMVVGKDFFEVLDIPIIKGRSFSKEKNKIGTQTPIIINDTATKYLNFKTPLGKKINAGDAIKGKVVGVAKDFHYASLTQPIEPLIVMYSPRTFAYMLIKIDTDNIEQTIIQVEEIWSKLDIKYPLTHFFLDDNFSKLYDKERNLLVMYAYFAILTILISCLGLFGLTSFTTEQRLKEIGIRKALGASNLSIVKLISKDFLLLVILANIIAIPLTIYFMNHWLNTFPYHISLTWLPFLLSAIITLIIALLTVGFLSFKAAQNNPIKVLKYE